MPLGTQLSSDERAQADVLQDVGLSNKKIAEKLGRSRNMINNYVHNPGTIARNPSLKPASRLQAHHKVARLNFCRVNMITNWEKVVFSDEKKFNLDVFFPNFLKTLVTSMPCRIFECIQRNGAVARFTRGHFSELIQKDAGGEGVIYAAKHDIHGNVMVKVFTSPNNKYSEQEVKTLIRVICHQNIVRLLGTFYFEDGTDAMRCGYVMEFMANGSLSAVIHDLSIKYNDNQVYSWIQQAGRGIAYLHSQNIIHRDVNTRNMLLGETIDVLKISDFGLAKPDASVTERNTCLIGTIVYMAPEVVNDQGVNSAADVYSLGISTWEMFHRKKPFYEHDSLSLFSLGSNIIKGTRPKIELRMEEEMKNLILRSFQDQYKLRPKASDFSSIAVKLAKETNVSSNAPKAQKTSLVESMSSLMSNDNNTRQYFTKSFTPLSPNATKAHKATLVTPPSRPLLLEIQNSFDSKLTLLVGSIRGKRRAHKTILAFEHNTKTWKELDIGIPFFFLVSGAVVLHEELYAFGGDEMGNAGLFKLNSENRSWINLTNGQNLSFLHSVAYRSRIYAVLDNCETMFAYDPVAKSWSKLAPIKETMLIEGITVLNDKLYIFGKGHYGSMEAGYYDTVEDEWTYLWLDLPVHVSRTPPVTYKNELVFFANSNVYASNFAERTSLKKLPQMKSWREFAAIFTCGNSLFVAGGVKSEASSSNDKCSDEVESFDGMTWTEMPRMPYGVRASTTVTATGDLAKQLLKWSC